MRFLMACLLCGLLVLLGSCTTSKVNVFDQKSSQKVDAFFIEEGTNFSRYKRVLLDELAIIFPDDAPLNDAEQKSIRATFQQAFNRYNKTAVAKKAGHQTILVRSSVIDLRAVDESSKPSFGKLIDRISQAGELTFLLELQDSKTKQVLARIGDVQPQGSNSGAQQASQLEQKDVSVAANYWAEQLALFLQQNLASTHAK